MDPTSDRLLINFTSLSMNTIARVLFVGLLASAAVRLDAQSPAPDRTSIESVRTHVRYLAGDALKGRRAGTPENEKAAVYIANHFREFGLKPLPGASDYFLRFDYTSGATAGTGNKLALSGPIAFRGKPVAGKNFTPLGFSSNGAAAGPLVFVGYGITAEELNYDDYAGVDVRGSIAIVMRQSPDGDAPHGSFARYAPFTEKVRNAREHGVAGIIFIDPPSRAGDLMKVSLDRMFTNCGLPVVFADYRLLSAVRDANNRTIETIALAIDSTQQSSSFAVQGVAASMTVDLKLTRSRIPNIVGYLPGTDRALADQYIVVGGHMDHLGMGGEGSLASDRKPAVHHGADDNASGTAGVLELARRFAARRDNRRPIIFACFNAEEEGLIGSANLVNDSLFPTSNVIAMLNMDMIGRLDSNKMVVQGIGSSPIWEELVTTANGGKLTVTLGKEAIGPSDHSSFYNKEIPVLFFFTGTHKDYHRPSDTWEKVNYDGEVAVLALVEQIMRAIDGRADRVPYSKAPAPVATSGGFRVYVGTIPDYAYDGKGLRLSGVAEGGPAEKGGLRGGDVMIRFAHRDINNIYDYTAALGELKPKDRVDVEYIRNGKVEKTTVEVQGR